jgi:chemotaxis protein MotB
MSGPDVIIIKKKAKGHAAHGAAWKVAYADFVTAMMALFMVLWLVSQTDQKIRKQLSDYFRTGVFSGAPSVLEGGLGIADRGFVDTKVDPSVVDPMNSEKADRTAQFMRDAVERALGRSGFKKLANNITIRKTNEGILIQIVEGRDDLLFSLSSAALKPALAALLAALAPELTKLEQTIELHGHTDGRPFATAAGRNNWTLSFERAETARAELERDGVPPQLIGGVYAHGSTQPVDPDPLSPMNRRLAIFVRTVPASAGGDRKSEEAEAAASRRSSKPKASDEGAEPGPSPARKDPRRDHPN